MQNNSHNKTKLILVHGTWSPDTAWIQQGSALREAIKLHCPDCEEPVQFIWSGNNSAEGRQAASDKLIEQIEENSAQKHILIAHSHGGNVALQALHGKTHQKPIQNSVSGVICLNTPFLTLLRKDTQRMTEFILSLIMFLGVGFWYPIFVRDALPFWPIWPISALVLLYLVFSQLTYKKIKSWIDNRWLSYEKKFQPPRIKSIPFLCLNSGGDEAFTFLSVIDGISNLPSILVNRFMGVPLVLQVSAVLLLLHKIARYTDLFSLYWIKSIEGSVFGIVLAIFKLPDLKGLGFDFSPDWPIVASFFEILGLAALYAAIFVFAVAILAIAFGSLSRVTTGTWKEPLLPLFVRQFITLTPVGCEKVEFYQYDASDDRTPLHSSLYNDPAAIDHIVKWINNLER